MADQLVIRGESDLLERCRVWVSCLPETHPDDAARLCRAILSASHPEFGTDWSEWWDVSEDYRHGLLVGVRLFN